MLTAQYLRPGQKILLENGLHADVLEAEIYQEYVRLRLQYVRVPSNPWETHIPVTSPVTLVTSGNSLARPFPRG